MTRYFRQFRSSLLCAALSALAFTLGGCGGGEKRGAQERDALRPDGAPKMVFRVGNGTEPQDIDGQTVTGFPEHKIIMALSEGLLGQDPRSLEPVPGMAERWDVSADGLTYTFHLREGLKWSDGSPLLASEIVDSFRRLLSPKLAANYAYLVYNFVAGAKDYYEGRLSDFAQVGFAAPDERTFVVRLKNPTPYLPKIIAGHSSWWPVPVKVIAQYGPVEEKRTPWTRVGHFVGNGPFRLKEWSPNQRIVVERNPHYWDAKTVKLDEIHFYATDDIAADERLFRTGKLDLTDGLPNSKIPSYARDHPELLRRDPLLALYFYRVNVTRPPLNDKRIRRALALAIDRESLVRNVTRGGEQPAYAVSYPGTAGYFPEAQLSGSLEEARALLAEAGYPEGRGLPKIELLYNTSENHRAIAEAVQQMWKTQLGVEVELVNQEWKVYLDRQSTGDYTLLRGGWVADYIDPHVFLEIWETGNGNNNTGWGSPEYDRLLHAALAAQNDEERYRYYQQMDAILIDELPIIPVHYYVKKVLLSPRVKGYYPTLIDIHPYKYISIENAQ
ncbi:peptide ABC transporter substrate-binding protein [Cephaloticoccus primus]|uniref:Peptide ABC transporter substrate-binding protein n=1 Tax=Cephaloticoccus primus TaxID=1548207 RepID=A0A139SN08_9BACT|nr:peptide ABC transporter substrate-binding protein [Cephaloticoccus primus]KXU35909.1 peptide ABC transporter substrate-binding protein [Cephaloticoccus primus]